MRISVEGNMGKVFTSFVCIMSVLLAPVALAAENDDIMVLGFELEKLLSFVSAMLAVGLATLTFAAYARTRRTKLVFVAVAFSLFAIKLFMLSSELFIEEIAWVDPVSAFLDFAILLSFFYGVITK